MTSMRQLGTVLLPLFLLSPHGAFASEPIQRGDTNHDGMVSMTDVIGILRWLTVEGTEVCLEAADANSDGQVDYSDALFLAKVLLTSEKTLEPMPADTSSCAGSESYLESLLAGSLLLADNLSTQPPEGPGKYMYTAPPGAIWISSVTGKKALLVQCIAGQKRDPNGRVRSELALWDPSTSSRVFAKDPIGSERWYALSVCIPTSWWIDQSKVLIMQWHGTEDPQETGIGRNPALALQIDRSNLVIRQLWSARRIQTVNENRVDLWSMPIKKGQWMRFVFHMKWSYRTDGFLQVWKDGTKIINQANHPNCYNDALGPYFKFGIYWPEAINRGSYSSSAVHTLNFSNLKIGDQRTSFEVMLQ